MRPLAVIMWFRKIPSSRAPMRRIAARDFSFSESVLSSTRMQPSVSKACLSRRYFASVLTAVRRHSRPANLHAMVRAFDVAVARAPDGAPRGFLNQGKWQRHSSFLFLERGLDVRRYLLHGSTRHGNPPPQFLFETNLS